MRFRTSFAALATVLAVFATAGCDAQGETVGIDEPMEANFAASPRAALVAAAGGGHFDAGVPVQFAFSAVQENASGDATGRFNFSAAIGGLAIDFHGRVTCMTVDLENQRAWIGGVVTHNMSEYPPYTSDIHQVGRDIWFRLVDYGQGASAMQVDRTTFVGFEGGAGIITSQEYCETQPWPEGDERTGPLLDGNITING